MLWNKFRNSYMSFLSENSYMKFVSEFVSECFKLIKFVSEFMSLKHIYQVAPKNAQSAYANVRFDKAAGFELQTSHTQCNHLNQLYISQPSYTKYFLAIQKVLRKNVHFCSLELIKAIFNKRYGYLFFMVTLLSSQQSRHILNVPSALRTKIIGAPNGDFNGLM